MARSFTCDICSEVAEQPRRDDPRGFALPDGWFRVLSGDQSHSRKMEVCSVACLADAGEKLDTMRHEASWS